MGFWLSRSTRMVASMRRRPLPVIFFLEAVDHHFAAVGQLRAQLLEQLLAQQLGGEEALVAVGELVEPDTSRALPAAPRAAPQQLGDFLPVFALTGTIAANSRVFDSRVEVGQQLRAVLDGVDLVDRRRDLLLRQDLVQHRLVLGPKRSASPPGDATSASRAASVARRSGAG